MVLVGFFCVVGAVGLLVVGLVQSDPDLVWASIGASAVGGLAVAVASMQRSRALRKVVASGAATSKKPEAAKPEAAKPEAAKPEAAKPEAAKPEAAKPAPDQAAAERVVKKAEPAAATVAEVGVDDADEQPSTADAVDPQDEPAEEDVDMADLLVVIDLTDEVLVVDLRPRYHLAACAHLVDREAIPLPVNEAREDGFTPCGLCRPDAALATAVRQAKASAVDRSARGRPRPSA